MPELNQGTAGKTEQAGLWSLSSRRDLECKTTELDELCVMKIEAVMNSGAAKSGAPADMARWVPISESAGSRRGQTYMSASLRARAVPASREENNVYVLKMHAKKPSLVASGSARPSM